MKAAHGPAIQQDPRALTGVRRGSILRSYVFALGNEPSYILDFDFGCRCQAVGNWVSPGGVMSVAHPPASWRRSGFKNRPYPPSRANFKRRQFSLATRVRAARYLEPCGAGNRYWRRLLNLNRQLLGSIGKSGEHYSI